MSTLALSLLQPPLVWMDGEANLAHFDRLLAPLIDQDLILLPEIFTTGFSMEAAGNALPEQRVVAWLGDWAQRPGAMVGGSAAIATPAGAVNRFLLVQPNGVTHRYDKRHLFRMAYEHHHYQAGQERVVVGWRILPLVCYDLRFPLWSRNRQDYDLALYVANWPAARAIKNQAYVAGCNRVGDDGNRHHYSGNSLILDPMGTVLAQAEPDAATCLQARPLLTSWPFSALFSQPPNGHPRLRFANGHKRGRLGTRRSLLPVLRRMRFLVGMVGNPVVSDILTTANPHPFVLLDIIQKTLQHAKPARPAKYAAVHADGKHLG
ncbi:2-oxoglutaramate amidase [Sodalis glossinidius str. 'morsitans']|uniref:2-oxoglutaramate amidase n=1 Tax=Sodalis glossinidius (strain morsitans) TaxID=343509 RepID=Q2NVF6_SODGM|nr:putative amidohydrolase [Sodalis glossinidius str. 'morsitans']CRL44316.1 2-oxoglutaramate amidase [Sodalis glossinidius str. 'morsitans']